MQINQLTSNNIVPFDQSIARFARCVDPRYTPESAKLRPLAQTGADVGSLMTVSATMRKMGQMPDIDAIFARLVEYLGGIQNFHFHTDHHATHKKSPVPGCGHIAKAYAEPEAYLLTKNDMEEIVRVTHKSIFTPSQCDVLQGEHNEKSVIIVQSETHSLISLDPDNQFFTYQQTLAERRIHDLAGVFGLPYDALLAAHTTQLTATVERLAKGLPIYTVSIDAEGKIN